jgi:hypothetical protein
MIKVRFSGMPTGLSMSNAAPAFDTLRTEQSMALPPNSTLERGGEGWLAFRSLQRLGADAVLDVPVERIALQHADLGCHRSPFAGTLP